MRAAALSRLSRTFVFFAILLSPVGGLAQSYAQSGGSIDFSVSPDDLHVIKLRLERELTERTGVSAVCILSLERCVAGYERLLRVDWFGTAFDPDAVIIVGDKTRVFADGRVMISDRETPERLTQLFNATPREVAEISAIELLRRLEQDSVEQVCTSESERLRQEIVSPRVCEGRDEYYGRLFAGQTFEVTVVRGYFDNPPGTPSEGVRGVATHIGDDERYFRAQIEDLVDNHGFRVESQSETEAVVTRSFYFGGNLKTARVRILRSTVRCPGEPDTAVVFRETVCREQREVTRRSRRAFRAAFDSSQLVIYAGHSRYGRGPDFGPNFRRDGRFPIREGALTHAHTRFSNPENVLYLNSCSSTGHFTRAVERARSRLGRSGRGLSMVSNSDAEYWVNNAKTNNQLIVGLMEGQCPNAIAAMLDHSRSHVRESRTDVNGLGP